MSVVTTMDSKRVTDEVRHANNDLERFYLESRRNKKLAAWAAKKLDYNKKDYFLELVGADLSHAGPDPVVERISADFAAAGVLVNKDTIWQKLRDIEQEVILEQRAEK